MLQRNESFTCSTCGASLRIRGFDSVLVICRSCGAVMPSETFRALTDFHLPDDWSVVQIGSSGVYQKKNYEVIGRVRLQLQQDYRNFWCLWYPEIKKYDWLVESFGKFTVYDNVFFDLHNSLEFLDMEPGHKFIIHDKVTVFANYQDQCEWVSLEGELCSWPSLQKGFAFIDAQNNDLIAACFIIPPDRRAGKFLVGQIVNFRDLNLASIREWDEWK